MHILCYGCLVFELQNMYYVFWLCDFWLLDSRLNYCWLSLNFCWVPFSFRAENVDFLSFVLLLFCSVFYVPFECFGACIVGQLNDGFDVMVIKSPFVGRWISECR